MFDFLNEILLQSVLGFYKCRSNFCFCYLEALIVHYYLHPKRYFFPCFIPMYDFQEKLSQFKEVSIIVGIYFCCIMYSKLIIIKYFPANITFPKFIRQVCSRPRDILSLVRKHPLLLGSIYYL